MVHYPLQMFPFARPSIIPLSTNLRSQNTRLHKGSTVAWYPAGPDLRCLMPGPSDQVYIFATQNGNTAINSPIPPDFPFQIDDITSHAPLRMVTYIIFGPLQAVHPEFPFRVYMP
jgi:hypothetical protein